MEGGDYTDAMELQNRRGERICITWQLFSYGADSSYRKILGCNLRRQQLQQGEHLLKRCDN